MTKKTFILFFIISLIEATAQLSVIRAETARSGGQILFASNSTIVGKQFHGHLEELANLLQSSPELRVVLVGHSDQTATSDSAYNKLLSLNRAKSVKRFLMRKGVSGSRIEVSTSGYDLPIADNSTPLGRAQNRRVEIKLLPALPPSKVDPLAPPTPLSPLVR